MDAIKTVNLTKYYGKAKGIENLNLTVQAGEFFGFIGPNGAGKSTTIRTLLGLITPTSGTAQIFGLNIVKEKENILQKVGYLPAEAVFYPGMRVKDMLKLSADLRKMNCTGDAKILCERLHLDETRKVDELSFGNRKKVAIVCALQHRPELLILDEPTGGLDPLMQKEFFDILRERNEEGTTVFFIQPHPFRNPTELYPGRDYPGWQCNCVRQCGSVIQNKYETYRGAWKRKVRCA